LYGSITSTNDSHITENESLFSFRKNNSYVYESISPTLTTVTIEENEKDLNSSASKYETFEDNSIFIDNSCANEKIDLGLVFENAEIEYQYKFDELIAKGVSSFLIT